ncbi:MAG TPA: DUF3011 domain-containing protein [Xanthomonadaceae bacterium]|jgi:hypothetical protein
MERLHLHVAIVAATLAFGYSVPSFAQDPVTGSGNYVNGNGQVVHCVSTESGRTYCGKPHMHYVIAGPAPTACVEGSTWGVDDRGVWVTGGCVADFNATPARTTKRVTTTTTTTTETTGGLVHCIAGDNGRVYCGHPHHRYVIAGTVPAACVENTTWGVDDRGVWVTAGCTADFKVED